MAEQTRNPTSATISNEARAQMVVDAIGRVGDGDYRKRVYAAALEQIRAAASDAFLRPAPIHAPGEEHF